MNEDVREGAPTGDAELDLPLVLAGHARSLADREPTPADLAEVARLHCDVLPDGFLAQLGPRVLYQVYAGAASAPGTVWLVRRHGSDIAGFLLATTDTRALLRHILLRRGLNMLPHLARAAARNPRLIGRMLESLRYPALLSGTRVSPGGAELVAIGIRPEFRASGHATALVAGLNAAFARRGVRGYTVSVYASNERANAFYRKLGFERLHEFQMYGTPWIRYRLDLAPEPPR